MYSGGAKRITIGRLYHKLYGINPTSVYHYLNADPSKYRCYNKTYQEYQKSELFLGYLVHTIIRTKNFNTNQIALKYDVPIETINRCYKNFTDDHKTTSNL